jgi:hypothetical protein
VGVIFVWGIVFFAVAYLLLYVIQQAVGTIDFFTVQEVHIL